MIDTINITICIVTYNGQLRLNDTFYHINQLVIPENVLLSIVIVDNASTDDTYQFINSYCADHFKAIKVIIKRMLVNDLAKARQLAYEGLDTDFVVTCDDDNLFPSDYLIIGLSYFLDNPKIGVLGGKGILPSHILPPVWFDEFAYYFGCGKQAEYSGDVSKYRNVVYGAGMWHKHRVVQIAAEMGYLAMIESRKGTRLGGGEDSEICWVVKYLGYEVWYADDLVFIHNISSEKLTETYKLRLVNSLSVQKDIYSNIHQRIFLGDIKGKVNLFWLKELMYHIKSLFSLIFFVGLNNKSEFNRIVYYIKQLIKENNKYDKHINRLLDFREKSINYTKSTK